VSKINQTPRGLQSLLGNVNQGVNPSDLSQVVSPGVDLFPFWAVEKTKFQLQGASVAHVVGQGIELIVPEGKLWMPLVVSSNGFNLSGQGGQISIHITDNSATARPVLAVSEYNPDRGVTVGVACSAVLQKPFVMSAGNRFRAEWLGADGPNTNSSFNIDLMYIEIQA